MYWNHEMNLLNQIKSLLEDVYCSTTLSNLGLISLNGFVSWTYSKVLGNWAKTLHPRNVGFAEIREINSWINFGMKSSVSWKGNVHEEILMGLKCFSGLQVICENNSRIWLLCVNLLSNSGWLKPAKFWNQEPAKFWNQESAKFWNLRSLGIWWSLDSGAIVSDDFHE
jgi:hypothetical protein